MDRASTPIYVCLPDETSYRPTLLLRLGQGGSKVAYEMNITSKWALLIGNADVSNPCGYWNLMIENEVGASDKLKSYGLLTSNNIKTKIYLDSELTKEIPAYFSDKFSGLIDKWVIDTKNPFSSTWRGNLFSSEEEMCSNFEKWRKVLELFYLDIDILYRHSVSSSGDHLNYVIIKLDDYYVRFYGFDFSSKSGSVLEFSPRSLDPQSSHYLSYKYDQIRRVVENLMFQEYEGWNISKFTICSKMLDSLLKVIHPRPDNYASTRSCIIM